MRPVISELGNALRIEELVGKGRCVSADKESRCLLISMRDSICIKTAARGSKLYKLIIIKVDPEFLCELFTDLMTAAAILTADCNDYISLSHHIHLAFRVDTNIFISSIL